MRIPEFQRITKVELILIYLHFYRPGTTTPQNLRLDALSYANNTSLSNTKYIDFLLLLLWVQKAHCQGLPGPVGVV
jgi:hypothetical protein